MAVSSGTSIRAPIRALNFLSSSSPARSYLHQGAPSRADACFIRPRDLYHLDGLFIKKKKKERKIQNYLLQLLTKTQDRGNISRAPNKALEVTTQMEPEAGTS